MSYRDLKVFRNRNKKKIHLPPKLNVDPPTTRRIAMSNGDPRNIRIYLFGELESYEMACKHAVGVYGWSPRELKSYSDKVLNISTARMEKNRNKLISHMALSKKYMYDNFTNCDKYINLEGNRDEWPWEKMW